LTGPALKRFSTSCDEKVKLCQRTMERKKHEKEFNKATKIESKYGNSLTAGKLLK